jgi:hypothetical protein
MSTMVWLAIGSVAAVAALFIALAAFLILILSELGRVGGTPVSLLAKIRMGLRAIEVETGYIPREVSRLNAGLGQVRDGLLAVDGNLGRLAAALQQQERR